MKLFAQYTFMAWFAALIGFGLIEWRAPGFVSFVFPVYFLIIPPVLALVVWNIAKKEPRAQE